MVVVCYQANGVDMNFIRNRFMTAYRERIYPNYWDVIAFLWVFAVIALFAWNARQMTTPYQVGQVIAISLKPNALPFYAIRTVTRMLIALLLSLIFTFIFGTWAAKSARAERVIIPVIDILQSVPILGYLSVIVPTFIAIFPGSLLGPECAAIFVIFTSQAWNMAFGFYQTVRTVPSEVQEAARMLHLNAWQRFWRIEVPFSMPSLLWNAMASMSAGWFFVVAAEAITVSNQEILLPGIGSFIAVAIQAANREAIAWAVLAMLVVILIYDQLLFRPLVAWAEKFKADQLLEEKAAQSWVIDFFRRTRMLRHFGLKLALLFDNLVNLRFFHQKKKSEVLTIEVPLDQYDWRDWAFNALIILFGVAAFVFLIYYFMHHLSMEEIGRVFLLGTITAARVFILILLCSVIWVPVGIWIGLRPRIAHVAQPIAQLLSAFPANLLYPFIVSLIVIYHLNPDIWLTPLMILGAQWYILFNVIAGASVIPRDLLQATNNLRVTGWLRAKRLLLPAIFPYYVTGAITAAGGAWNASIVAEIVSWGDKKLVATGLGAYITEYTARGSFPHIALGIGMMCLWVLVINRVLWRPLYNYAESRFILE